mgnify:CR=1 FL=1
MLVEKFNGAVIREIRKKKGINQKQLAMMVGLSNSYLSDIEVGRTNPSINTLIKITAALQIDVSDLLPKQPRNVKGGE